ncbi:DRTGG domain-containing protein [Treponema sp.]
MTFLEIIEQLPAHLVNRSSDFPGRPLRHVIASDLMSDVLVVDFEDVIIVTSLASEQTVRTADIVGARAILLVNDKTPQLSMKSLAEQQDITVLSTPLSMFEACVALGHLLALTELGKGASE